MSRVETGINGLNFLDSKGWSDKHVHTLTFPEGQRHYTFFKSKNKRHLFSMTHDGMVFEVIKTRKKSEPFELVRVF